MTTDAEIGFGTVLQMGNGLDPEAFAVIGQVVDPGSLDKSIDAVDGTHARSADANKEFIPGLVGNTYSTTIIYKPGSAEHVALMAKERVVCNWRVLHDNASATYWLFRGFWTSANHGMPLEDKKTLALTFQISGMPTLGNLS